MTAASLMHACGVMESCGWARAAGAATLRAPGASTPASAAWWAAAVVALLLAAARVNMRHALCSTPIPAGTPTAPGGLPLIGHALPVLRNWHRLHDWLLECAQRVGEGRTFAISLPFQPTKLVVTDPACLEHVLKARLATYQKTIMRQVMRGPHATQRAGSSCGGGWLGACSAVAHVRAGCCGTAAVCRAATATHAAPGAPPRTRTWGRCWAAASLCRTARTGCGSASSQQTSSA
jgi:hypothetical protein